LRDLKNRETELKRLHKLDLSDDSSLSDDNDADWSPGMNGKLSRSIDVLNNTSPSPILENASRRPIPPPRNGMRPAVSLAALCDFDFEESEAPSSHKLIERWECIIQENQQRERSHNIH
jgi:hypothetical protein